MLRVIRCTTWRSRSPSSRFHCFICSTGIRFTRQSSHWLLVPLQRCFVAQTWRARPGWAHCCLRPSTPCFCSESNSPPQVTSRGSGTWMLFRVCELSACPWKSFCSLPLSAHTGQVSTNTSLGKACPINEKASVLIPKYIFLIEIIEHLNVEGH